MFPVLRNVFANRLKRRTPAVHPASGVESLEARQVLASADLTMASEVLIEVEPAGANHVHIVASALVVNEGPVALVANDVDLVAVLSTDAIFGNGDDIDFDIDLLDLNLLPGTVANASLTGNVTRDHYDAANYLLIKIDPNSEISEESDDNNVGLLLLPQMPTLTTSIGQTVGKTNRPVRVDPDITFTDSFASNFNDGQLRVSVAGDSGDNNVLSIKRIKTDLGVIRRRQNELRLGNQTIGTIAGGTNTQELVISFSDNINVNEMQKIASAVSLKGKKGVPGVRTVEFYVVESQIVTGFVASKQVSLT